MSEQKIYTLTHYHRFKIGKSVYTFKSAADPFGIPIEKICEALEVDYDSDEMDADGHPESVEIDYGSITDLDAKLLHQEEINE